MESDIALLLVLILLSGFFSGAEMALFSLSEAKVRALVEQKVKNAQLLAVLKRDPQNLLITLLIGNNLVNISASSIATLVAVEKFGSVGAGIATGIMTVVILFFGEIVPKSFAQRYAKRLAPAIAPIIKLTSIVLLPAVWVMNFLTTNFQKIFKIEDTPLVISEDDVKAMVNLGHEEGSVERDELEMIEKVFMLNDTTARDVMTPSEYMVGFDVDDTLADALPIIEESGYSRFPVHAQDGTDVEGMLHLKDVFHFMAESGHGKIDSTKVSSLMRPAMFVPGAMYLDDLMQDFQKRRTHIAIVVDEHGSLQGLLTLEDLLEEIVGEITDETDVGSEFIETIDKHTVRLDPRAQIGKVNTMCNTYVSGPRHKTIGWLVLQEFGRIPDKGDSVTIDHYKFIVEEASDRRIKRVLMVKTAQAKLNSTKKK